MTRSAPVRLKSYSYLYNPLGRCLEVGLRSLYPFEDTASFFSLSLNLSSHESGNL